MPQEDVEAILKKASTDGVFRRSLAKDFDKTIDRNGLDLTQIERDALVKVNWKSRLPTGIGKNAAGWVHIYS